MHPSGPVRGRISPPGSKSITNRALVCAALAEGDSILTGALTSDDTRVMMEALWCLGIEVTNYEATREIRVAGCGGRPPAREAELFVGNSGTTMRFLTPLVALGRGRFRLDGNARMRQRPMADQLDALAELGVSAASEGANGCPPIVVQANGLRGGRARIRGDVSSQFVSGLMMVGPIAEQGLELVVEGPQVSVPYVSMTVAVMSAFGAKVEEIPPHSLRVPGGQAYHGRAYAIEPDASAASYFFAAAAITGGEVKVLGLNRSSLQGDVGFVDVLARMGCRVHEESDGITVQGPQRLGGVEVDMNSISDTVQTLAAVAVFADAPTTISGVAHIRHKETDRISALATELRKFGAAIDERPDGLVISPARLTGAAIETYDDHRMAMSMALVGLRVPDVVILDPGCTAKTYPSFFDDLEQLAETR